jgi:2-(1,2-epoxy-1,2-dihydrophenyl)acetyl-CoA isomerase
VSVRFELRGEVALVTLDRPDVYNSVDVLLATGLVDAATRAGEEARAMVLTGAGKAFCAGADLADLGGDEEGRSTDLAALIRDRFNPVVVALTEAAVPTIAAVNGVAAGAGIGLAMACDLRVASDQASFVSAFINVALVPDSGSSWFLNRSVGLSRAMEIATSGRRVPADEAAAIGLVHRVVTRAHVVDEALAWADQLAAGPTGAYVATRKLLHRAAASTLAEALALEEQVQGELGFRAAHREGVRAFLEKRPPDFRSAGI